MRSSDFWYIFTQTGAPEAYMLFRRAQKMEAENVSENQWSGSSGDGLQ